MPLKTILELLGKAGNTFTSFSLNPLLKGRSNNTPAFLVASLLEEGIVHRSSSQKRCYELSDVTIFMGKIKASIESNSDIKEDIKTSKKKPVMASLFTE
jgi:hypothetical protein